ncbi:hypothetical protein NLJ89_g6010 [Agrocybe chaxingu]|uniref:Uncharacterized protein n=1 Tax=Agrocybe chaxingu TaxID=84603 RepID=A0A9W8K6F2_9AGAR|nr:hypothetical protein NLJ89_g6010 [Agrocybe chaxingu]
MKALQIQAIGLSFYEPVDGTSEEAIGNEVIRTQWLGPDSGKLLLGKRDLIVDKVDTWKTLQWVESNLLSSDALTMNNPTSYALSELKKDVEAELLSYPEAEREALQSATQFAVSLCTRS